MIPTAEGAEHAVRTFSVQTSTRSASARGEVPVARLIPIQSEAPRRQPGTLRGLVTVPDAFFDPLAEREPRAIPSIAC